VISQTKILEIARSLRRRYRSALFLAAAGAGFLLGFSVGNGPSRRAAPAIVAAAAAAGCAALKLAANAAADKKEAGHDDDKDDDILPHGLPP
jgi:hypothetical protein